MKRTILLTTLMIGASTLIGCAKSEPSSSTSSSTAKAEWLLTSAPAEALSVAQARADATEGQAISVRGRIGGRMEPITSDSSVFLIVDMDVLHCGQLGDEDHCSTPWDYCCEPSDNLAANMATVQLVNEAGDPLEVDPIAAGLSPLDEIVVVGTVAPRPAAGVLTIRATAVHRMEG